MKKSLLFLLWPSLASANIAAEIGVYSDFIWRGTTFTEHRPALQGEIDYEEDHGFFLGGFFSNAEFSDEAKGPHATVTQETDILLGKRWSGKNWQAQLMYGQFRFPNAGTFDTDEFNFTIKYKSFLLELSYMDDYFGYQGTYKYIRVGYEWVYMKSIDGAFFIGYNGFKNPKGDLKSRCLDASCSEKAFTTNGAGNKDYVDLYFVSRKTFKNQQAAELAFNWTNRIEYLADADGISSSKAQDFAIVVAYIVPFML